MMTKEELTELKEKHNELVKRACVYTNMAYALVEAADSFMIEVDSTLNKIGASVSRDEKHKFKTALQQGKHFRVWLKDITRKLYNLEIADEALDDSDAIYDLFLLIVDRCGGDMNILSHIRAMVFNSFESKYGFYK